MKRKKSEVVEPAPTDTTAKNNVDAEQNSPPTANVMSEAVYEEVVRKGKDAIAIITNKQWLIGDLADLVTKNWGEYRLEQYALDINYDGEVSTLSRCRDVCRAFPKNRVRPRFFASAQILATHPDRFEIVERNPTISKSAASELMRQWRAEQNGNAKDQADENDKAGRDMGEDTGQATGGENTASQGSEGSDGDKSEDTGDEKSKGTGAKGSEGTGGQKPTKGPRDPLTKHRDDFYETGSGIFHDILAWKDELLKANGRQRGNIVDNVDPEWLKSAVKAAKNLELVLMCFDGAVEAAEQEAEEHIRQGHAQAEIRPSA